jgi:hypothetical protein
VAEFSRVEHQSFASCHGERFALGNGDATIELTLTDVSARRVSGEFESFSLLFEGPAHPGLPQGLFELTHPSLGLVEIFLVPIADHGIRTYEAVFNRFAHEDARL